MAGRENGYRSGQRRQIVIAAVCRYREARRGFAGQANLVVWYARADVAELREQFTAQLSRQARKKADQVTAKARTRDSIRQLGQLTRLVDGRPRIVADPPLVVPADDLVPADADRERLQAELAALVARYRCSLGTVVGVGSVGTRCWIVLMLSRDSSDPLFLQVKEAGPSVLEDFAGSSKYANEGQRVVAGQRLMQAASDIFLGWHRSLLEPGTASYDFYIRQLRDWKASADVATMAPAAMRAYGQLCRCMLARAHARSGDRIASV